MPTQRLAPRDREPRLHLSCLERYDLVRAMQQNTELLQMVARIHRPAFARKRKALMALLVCSVGCMTIMLAAPRIRDDTARARNTLGDFGDHEFREHFRFRKPDFLRVLQAVGLTQPGRTAARWLRVGRSGKQIMIPADWALMVRVCWSLVMLPSVCSVGECVHSILLILHSRARACVA